MENAPSKFHRLKPGGEVRLRYGYIIKCERVVKDAAGNVTELRCSHDPASRSGSDESGRKVKGTIHWVSAKHARRRSAALRSPLLRCRFPATICKTSGAESRLAEVVSRPRSSPRWPRRSAEERFQFERLGYFSRRSAVDRPGAPVFNRTVTLRDSWAKLEQEALASAGLSTRDLQASFAGRAPQRQGSGRTLPPIGEK